MYSEGSKGQRVRKGKVVEGKEKKVEKTKSPAGKRDEKKW